MSFFEKNFGKIQEKKSKNKFTEIFFLLFELFWKIIKLAFAPMFWVYAENVKLYKFAFSKSEDRTLSTNELHLVRSLPTLYTISGIIGGVFVSLFAVLNFKQIFDTIVDALSSNIIEGVLGLLGSFISFVYYDVIVWAVSLIGDVFVWLFQTFLQAFAINPFLALFGLLVIGFLVIAVYLVFNEKLIHEIKKGIYYFIGSPDRAKSRATKFYRRINYGQFKVLLGDRDERNKQIYFKRLVLYSLILFVYSLISAISIALNPDYLALLSNDVIKVLFIVNVHLFAGFLSGTLFLKLVSILLDIFSSGRVKKDKPKKSKVIVEEVVKKVEAVPIPIVVEEED